MADKENNNADLPIEIVRSVLIEDQNKLIVCIVKKGYGYQVVKTATENGGKGAVIVKGRGISNERKKFFGIDIAPERELILMVVQEKFAYPVAKAIYAIADFKSNAKGIVFVLPISSLLD